MTPKRSFSMQDQSTGSPDKGEPEFLAIGKLRRPHGVRGEILMSVWTGFPERLEPGAVVYRKDDHTPLTIRSTRWHRDDLLIAFDEYPNREAVGVLRNQILAVPAESLPELEEGGLYLHQLIGMNVIDDDEGTCLGRITEIIATGANDVYVVRNEEGIELLLPAIESVILEIDVERNQIRVHLLPGL